MMTEAAARALREQHLENLAAWREPDGRLVPTEPDPQDRAETRAGLRAAISTLNRILGDEQDAPAAPPADGRRVTVRG